MLHLLHSCSVEDRPPVCCPVRKNCLACAVPVDQSVAPNYTMRRRIVGFVKTCGMAEYALCHWNSQKIDTAPEGTPER